MPTDADRRAREKWRFGVRHAMALVALCAIGTWIVLIVASPTRRLEARLSASTSAYARREAAALLGTAPVYPWERGRTVAVLVDTLKDGNPQVRLAALAGLGGRGADALPVLDRIVAATTDASGDVRFTATAVLGDLAETADADGKAVIGKTLLGMLTDSQAITRVRAAQGLLPIDEAAAVPPLCRALDGGDQMAATMARLALGKARRRTVEAVMVREARHPDAGRRRAALAHLKVYGTPEAIRAEMRRAKSDPDTRVREYAEKWIEALAGE